jgi:N-acetylglucosamine-6-phosphate deacetylase
VLSVRGGTLVTGPTRTERADLTVADGLIAAIGPRLRRGATLDVTGLLVAPGYLDAQCNGAFGIDLAATPERVAELAALLPATGVTSWCPTLVTSPPDRVGRLLTALAPPPAPGAAAIVGAHLEGPILNPVRRGAHPERLLRGVDEVDTSGWSRAAGVALVTLAPELPGALPLVSALRRRGVAVAAGHTDAAPDELDAAWAAGVRCVTHLYNGMPPLHHRRPGPPGWTLAHRSVVAGLIADGRHVDPLMVAVAFRALGPRRTMLVSDVVASAGLPSAGAVAALGDGTLAGGTTFLDQCVRNLVAFTGCPPSVAIACATAVPARLLGLADRGRLAVGRRADLVVLTHDLHVVGTVVAGVPSASLTERLTTSTSSPAGRTRPRVR